MQDLPFWSSAVQWEGQVRRLEKEHNEKLSDKIKRALVLNILPAVVHSRIYDHLDRLTTYEEDREKMRRGFEGSSDYPKYDLEIVVDTSDGMNNVACSEHDCRLGEVGGLTFMMAKRHLHGSGILYPDFSFHSWPEAECPDPDARGSHQWEIAVKQLLGISE